MIRRLPLLLAVLLAVLALSACSGFSRGPQSRPGCSYIEIHRAPWYLRLLNPANDA